MVEYLVRKRGLFQYLIAVWPVEADGPEIQVSAQTQDGSVAIRAKPTKKRSWLSVNCTTVSEPKTHASISPTVQG